MCVIVVADKRRPTDVELEKMALCNGDGAGIAWREGEKDRVMVKWQKGLTLEEIKPLSAKVPLPYVLHFRIATCGGKAKEMTHPFPVERDVSLNLSGSTRGPVLFHNGHWHPYKANGLDGAIRNKVRVPDGKWSDTRVMAWLTFLHGPGILEFIDEKVILFGPSKIEIFHPDTWFRVDNLLISNRVWENTYPKHNQESDYGYFSQTRGYSQICRLGQCSKSTVGTSWYCEDHQPACRWLNCRAPRVEGTENCANHQPICLAQMCSKPRVIGEKYCLLHLIKPSVKAIEPFQGGPEGDGNVAEKAEVPAILTDEKLQGESRWARSINNTSTRAPGFSNSLM